jgi:hypothetical protein
MATLPRATLNTSEIFRLVNYQGQNRQNQLVLIKQLRLLNTNLEAHNDQLKVVSFASASTSIVI